MVALKVPTFLVIALLAMPSLAQFATRSQLNLAISGTAHHEGPLTNTTDPSETIAAAKYPFDGWDSMPEKNTALFKKSACVPTPWSDDDRKAGRFPFPSRQGQNDCLPKQQNWYRCLDFPKVNMSVSEFPHKEGMPGEGYHYTSEFVRVFVDVYGAKPVTDGGNQQQQQQQQQQQPVSTTKYGPFEVHFMETVRPECYELERKVDEGGTEVFSIYHGQYVAAISEANVGMMARSPAIPLVESGKGTLHFKVQGIRLVASSLPKNKCFINTKLKGHKSDPNGKMTYATFTYDAVKILDMPPKLRDEYMRKHNITMEYLMEQEAKDEEHKKAVEKRNQLREELKNAGFTPGWTRNKKNTSGSYSHSAGPMPSYGLGGVSTVDAAMANAASMEEDAGGLTDEIRDQRNSFEEGLGIGVVDPYIYGEQASSEGDGEDAEDMEGVSRSQGSENVDMSYANPDVHSSGFDVSLDEYSNDGVFVQLSETSSNSGHSCVVYGDGPNGTANIHFEVTVPLDLPSLVGNQEQIGYLDASVQVDAISPTEPCILRLAVKYDTYRQGYGIMAVVFMLPPQNSGEGRPALLMK